MRPARSAVGTLSLLLSSVLAPTLPSSIAHAGSDVTSANATQAHVVSNDIPARRQWQENFGYCGETAMISAGLYYGQYVSQYDARAIASMHAPQSEEGSQLRLGVNETYAAARMHLNAVKWKGGAKASSISFLAWVKANVVAGYPVIIGVYENHTKFEDKIVGDEDYEHIVPVIGITSHHPFSKPSVYYDDDVIRFSDNGLYTGDDNSTYIRESPFKAFQATREEANLESSQLYTVPRTSGDYGLVITGIIDDDGKTLPVRVATNLNYEEPHIRKNSNARPKPEALTLTVTVSGLKPNVAYNLYRYDSFAAVPNASFNAQSSKAAKQWKICIPAGSTYAVKEAISSDRVAVYRAVPSTAP